MYNVFLGKSPAPSWLLPLHGKHAHEVTEIEPERECMMSMDNGDDTIVGQESEQGQQQNLTDQNCESWQEEGEEVIEDIANCFKDFLATSGDDILNALKKMKANLQDIKTPASLVSALVTFGKGTYI